MSGYLYQSPRSCLVDKRCRSHRLNGGLSFPGSVSSYTIRLDFPSTPRSFQIYVHTSPPVAVVQACITDSPMSAIARNLTESYAFTFLEM
ncbi:hypothetical protein SprV_0301271300 [Sparganum proliferum]